MGVLKGCKPRKEVLKGDLDDAIFAADFGDLIEGKAPKVYKDRKVFFQNTHPAKELSKAVRAVFERLGNPKEGGQFRYDANIRRVKDRVVRVVYEYADKQPVVITVYNPSAKRYFQGGGVHEDQILG